MDGRAGGMSGVASRWRRRAALSLLAGAVAIALNTIALWSADLVGLVTAHGGLLRLLAQTTGLALPRSGAFMAEFHVAVGLLMALGYAFVIRPLWPGPAVVLGLGFAAVVWLANAAIVLPLIGEGFAGSRSLGVAGILWFAAAHTLFFVALALLYDGLRRRFAAPGGRRAGLAAG